MRAAEVGEERRCLRLQAGSDEATLFFSKLALAQAGWMDLGDEGKEEARGGAAWGRDDRRVRCRLGCREGQEPGDNSGVPAQCEKETFPRN